MRLEVERQPLSGLAGAAILRMSGVIDTTTLNDFEKRLQETIDDGVERVLLDLEKVRYVNSSGFGALVKYSDHFKARGGGLALVHVPPKVLVVLEMLGLQAFFPIFQTQQAAEEAVSDKGAFPTPEPAVVEEEPPPAAPPQPAPAARVAPAPTVVATPDVAPAAGSEYPLVASCAVCSATLHVKGDGTYRCPGCRSVFEASPEGHVSFAELESDATAIHVALDTGTVGRRALGALVASVASSGAVTGLEDAVGELCDWVQSDADRAVRINVLAIGGSGSLRLDITDSGPERSTADLKHACAFFDRITVRRVSAGRNLTRAVLQTVESKSPTYEESLP